MTDETRGSENNLEHDVEHEAHRASCAECNAVWLDLDRISAEAAQLPRLAPSRDLWAGIEARIDAPVVAALPQARRSWTQRPPVRLAIAASLLVAATAGITWSIARQGITGSGTTMTAGTDLQDPATTAPNGTPGDARLASFDNTVAGMDREIEQLEAVLSEHRKDLDPRTIAVLQSNLAVIDAAIRESRAALEDDPASRFLAAQVARAYHSKLTLLRGAATLPTGI
jgi:hypothetical protein